MPNPKDATERRRRTEAAPEHARAASGPANPLHEDEEWDDVDEAAWESFPASDPPAHWAGADHPAAEDEDEG